MSLAGGLAVRPTRHHPGPPPSPSTSSRPNHDDDTRRLILVKVHLLFHAAFREEMSAITADAQHLDDSVQQRQDDDPEAKLASNAAIEALLNRYAFMYSCYKLHSTTEDKVLFPALELRVRNVVRAYSLEHEAEEGFFHQVKQQLLAAAGASGAVRRTTIRKLCHVCEAAQIALFQHLDKEEEHLLPLLQETFTLPEQVSMFWQLLCSMPVSHVGPVMQWVTGSLAPEDLNEMIRLLQDEVPEADLQELVNVWLSPRSAGVRRREYEEVVATTKAYLTKRAEDLGLVVPTEPDHMPAACDSCRKMQSCSQSTLEACGSNGPAAAAAGGSAAAAVMARERPPICGLVLVNDVIRAQMGALHTALQCVGTVGCDAGAAHELCAAMHRHQKLLSALCGSHSEIHLQVLFPEVHNRVRRATDKLTQGHGKVESLHKVLGAAAEAVVDHPGTPRAEYMQLLVALQEATADAAHHLEQLLDLEEEEMAAAAAAAAQLLPVVETHFTEAEQRSLLYNIMLAMPLKLLEHVMVRIGQRADPLQADALVASLNAAAVLENGHGVCQVLPCVLARWTQRDAAGRATPTSSNPSTNNSAALAPPSPRGDTGDTEASSRSIFSSAAEVGDKRKRRSEDGGASTTGGVDAKRSARGKVPVITKSCPESGPLRPKEQPIDHIFLFHRALRRELSKLEGETQGLLDLHTANAADPMYKPHLESVRKRFHFLWGIYKTHSKAEDEVVFPALESKDALHNVSHSYTLDHHHEETLFRDISEVMTALRTEEGTAVVSTERRRQLAHLAAMCKAMSVCVIKHLVCEDTELWPLFEKHFSLAEQESVIGAIVGRSSADVLQTMLPLIQLETTPREVEEMIHSIHKATKNTRFSTWLKSWWQGSQEGAAAGTAPPPPPPPPPAAPDGTMRTIDEGQLAADQLAAVAPYLQEELLSKQAVCGQLVVSWHNVYRLNQAHLEAAVRRVTADASLEPKRKEYLMQNLLTVRWLVAQQGLADGETPVASAAAAAGAAAAGPSHPPPPRPPLPPSAPTATPAPAPDTTDAPPPPAKQTFIMHPSSMALSYHDKEATPPVLGCKHYKRNCKLVASCCGKVVSCRHCHNEVNMDHPFKLATCVEMVCMQCGAQQPCAADCAACGTNMSRYFCSTCIIFDDSTDHDIYHCPFCNLCRRGKGLGIDVFHCMRCNQCMSLSLADSHMCREGALENDCPICHEDLFTSALPIHQSPCGHFMHSACYKEYTQTRYTCPICCKSMADMTIYFNMLRALIDSEKLPDEYKTKTNNILCNDCSQTGTAPFHFVYHQCSACTSFNTRVV